MATSKTDRAKSLPWPLLAILADGRRYSGQVLGARLGVSRSAVWKMVKQLEALGLEVESIRGSGYCLARSLELLSASAILSRLLPESRAAIRSLSVCRQIDSTNSAIASDDYRDGDVLFAEWQLAGRGRRGRQWVSPPASNLYFSLRWGFAEGVTVLEGLSLAVGLALAEALQDMGIPDVQLKWPNDLWLDGKKLGGVLIEIAGDVTGQCHAIVGIGLNTAMPQASVIGIDQAWTDLNGRAFEGGRNALAAALLNRLVPLLMSYQTVGFSHYRTAWLARSALQGKAVSVFGAQALTGVVVGISASGALILATEQGQRHINGGEVSVRVQ